MPNMECKYLGVDIQDNQGRHEVGYLENTRKLPINKDKGCSFGGNFNINKVPGNFHISTHSTKERPPKFDFNHEVVQLYFGDRLDPTKLPGVQTDLAGKRQFNLKLLLMINLNLGKKTVKGQMSSHDYTIKIVPTVFTDKNKKTIFGYQYTAVYKDFHNPRGTPAIWFRYEISPITVKYTERVSSFFKFIFKF